MMVMQWSQIHKKAALTLILVYLSLSVFMVMGMGSHAMHHGQATHHAAQHASFVCAWMCSASNFVDSADRSLSQTDDPLYERLAVFIHGFYKHSSSFSFYIRPPPITPSL
ncbi:MAG: hypothetical protein L0Y56_02675 [Nitrospira sp.]|nr:hypothetical protein [Nitrospira sp.]